MAGRSPRTWFERRYAAVPQSGSAAQSAGASISGAGARGGQRSGLALLLAFLQAWWRIPCVSAQPPDVGHLAAWPLESGVLRPPLRASRPAAVNWQRRSAARDASRAAYHRAGLECAPRARPRGPSGRLSNPDSATFSLPHCKKGILTECYT